VLNVASARATRTADPRRAVFVGIALALIGVLGLGTLLADKAGAALTSVHHVRTSIQPPMDRLDEALAANAAGERQLHDAAGATGDERNRALTRSITYGEASAKAWTKYLAAALPLRGEQRLAARYARGYDVGKATAARGLIPILRSSTPTALPPEQVAAAELNQKNLLALRQIYQREEAAQLTALERWAHTAEGRVRLVTAIGVALVALIGAITWRSARRVLGERRSRAEAAETALFEAQVVRALELADDEDEAFAIAARATTGCSPGAQVTLLASDASGTNFTPVVGLGPCQVSNPDRCPAIRAGAPLHFSDSSSLDACPRLGDHPDGSVRPCSVTCLPVSVAGRDMAVLQLTRPVGQPAEVTDAARLVIRRTGERITMMRAFAQFELQASRDPLTGLHNRRSLEAAVTMLHDAGTTYSVAFADLDHFKRLNDVHGHDAGDRALRAFARTLTNGLRPEDLCGRWGGEEFLVVLPDCDEDETVEAMTRIQASMTSDQRDGLTAPVTVSIGVAQGRPGQGFPEVVAHADEALRRAKSGGRDRVTVWKHRTLGPARAI